MYNVFDISGIATKCRIEAILCWRYSFVFGLSVLLLTDSNTNLFLWNDLNVTMMTMH